MVCSRSWYCVLRARCSNGSDSTPPEGRAPISATTLNSSAAGCGRGEWSRACSATSSKSPNPEWVGAAEALLGRDREAVFVDRADISAATSTFKEGRREFRHASLVSLNKLEQFRAKPECGTFPSIFRSQDPDAMAFIMRRYGTVRLADIESNELRQYERQARQAAEKASTLLRGEFINALTARIGKMERELQSLNRIISRLSKSDVLQRHSSADRQVGLLTAERYAR
jgi:hypothetical protein